MKMIPKATWIKICSNTLEKYSSQELIDYARSPEKLIDTIENSIKNRNEKINQISSQESLKKTSTDFVDKGLIILNEKENNFVNKIGKKFSIGKEDVIPFSNGKKNFDQNPR
jgi:hypothetical protein